MQETTLPAPPGHHEFCRLVEAARHHKLPGHWSGSVYRHHPCGVIRDGMVFCSEWNTNDYCYVEVILDRSARLTWENDSHGGGDPHPRPSSGGMLRVYSSGTWCDDGPWRARIVGVLDDLRGEVAAAEEAQRRGREEEDRLIREKRAATVRAAAAMFTDKALAQKE